MNTNNNNININNKYNKVNTNTDYLNVIAPSIYACFGRSFDCKHIKSGKIHLTASILGGLETMTGFLSSLYSNLEESTIRKNDFRFTSLRYRGAGVYAKYLFIVNKEEHIRNYVLNLKSQLKEKNLDRYEQMISEGIVTENLDEDGRFIFGFKSTDITVVFISLHELIGNLQLIDDSLFKNIFGKFDDEKKDPEAILNNSLFIFRDYHWWYIVLIFKINNVNISGGLSNRRHLINSVEIQLINYLNLFGLNSIYEPLDKRLNKGYLNKKNKLFLNNKIPFNELEKVTKFKGKLNEQKLIEIQQKINNDELVDAKDKPYYSFLIENILFCNNNLIKWINDWFDTELTRLSQHISRIENQTEKDKVLNEYFKLNEMYEVFTKEVYNLSPNELNDIFEYLNNMNKDKSVLPKFNMFPFYTGEWIKAKNDIYLRNISKSIGKRKYSTIQFNRKFLSDNSLNLKYFSVSAHRSSKSFKDPEPVLKTINLTDSKNSGKFKLFLDSDNNMFLNFLNKMIHNSHLKPKEMQFELEKNWANHLLDKMNQMDNRTRNSLGYVMKKADETLNLTLELKQKRKNYPNIYKEFNKRHLFLAYSILIHFYNRMGFTAIAMKIGSEILWDINKKEWLSLIKSDLVDYINFNQFIDSKGFKKIDILKMGLFFVEIFCTKPTEIFVKSFKNVEVDYLLETESLVDKDLSFLIINEDYFELIQQNLIITPISLPMLCKPNIWSDTEYGGFLENQYNKNSIITGSFNQKHTMVNKDSLFKAVNTLNSNKFKINTLLLDYLENDGLYILEQFFKNLKDKTDKTQSKVTLKIAKILAHFNHPLYINHSGDWRGRIYTNSFYLSYQGGELANSLLNLFEGMVLSEKGKEYLYIYGANCYNENNLAKKSFDDRYKWVESNLDKIINLDKNFILKAKNLLLFTSFCLNMRELVKDKNFIVNMPIFLDATCSGIQHIAALIKDFESGQKVNLIPQKKSDTVGDIYSDLLEPINQAINLYGEINVDCVKFKNIKLRRDNIKQPIMTKLYNVSTVGIADQLRNSFDKIVNKDKTIHYLVPSVDGFIKFNYREMLTLAQIINGQIFKSVPSLKALYVYLKEIVNICLKCNIPIRWFTPTGLIITQMYMKSIQMKVSINFKGKSSTIVLREMIQKVDSRKQMNAIIPNIIHSLDAAHLMQIVNRGILNMKCPYILTVHDCFGTHPNNIVELKDLVKTEFIKIYTDDDFLKNFHNRILQNLIDNSITIFSNSQGQKYIKVKSKKFYIPDLPKPGELNYKDIVFSEYFIN